MPISMSTGIEGVKELQARLRNLAKESQKHDTSAVSVGYTAPYAIYVHEDLTAHHEPGKKAKFLSGPARRLARELGELVAAKKRKGATMLEAHIAAARRLLEESRIEVPVDTSFLQKSWFIRNDKTGTVRDRGPTAEI
jgi:hypothetical protein